MLMKFGFPGTINTLMDEVARDFNRVGSIPSLPLIDIVEANNEYQVTVELPGVQREDINVVFEDGIMTISGERKQTEWPEGVQVFVNEIRSSQFKRSIRFANNIESGKISAELQNGLLKVRVPKAEEAKPKQIEIVVK